MPAKPKRVKIRGSEKNALPGARSVGPIDDNERLEVTVRLRSKKPLEDLTSSNAYSDTLPRERNYLSRDELNAIHGADPQDIAKIEAFARAHKLVVVEVNPEERRVVLSGTAAAFSAAFNTKIEHFEFPDGTYRGRIGALSVTSDIADIVEGVFGIDNRPQARPHYQWRDPETLLKVPADKGMTFQAQAGTFTSPQLAILYDFPHGLDGTGQCVAIIELGGGYRPADLKNYFHNLGLPVPKVKAISVDGGRNQPTNANSADGEVLLDIEVAAALAPKATIAVYFAPNTDQGFLDAISKALHDNTNKPSVISISWGGPEASWTAQSLQQYNQVFQTAAALGVTICCAAGDSGSSDGETDGKQYVDFPASSPFVLGCGGTKVVGSGKVITSETVWNENPNSATGGGVSATFPLPAYQKNAQVPPSANPGHLPGRGVPDVAGDADPASGYQVRVDGHNLVFGGTSAVAPLYSGLVALINQKLGAPVGYLNPIIYGPQAVSAGLFNDVTTGNNGAYSAGQGWDACTGWGSPDGNKLLTFLSGQ
jgi:kumamolisin